MKLDDHPTVKAFYAKASAAPAPAPAVPLDSGWLRQLCRDAGADDVGLVEIGRPALDHEREDILRVFPQTRTLLSFVRRLNREPIRSPARSVSNLEFHHTGDDVNEIARSVVETLEKKGVRALNPAQSFYSCRWSLQFAEAALHRLCDFRCAYLGQIGARASE